MEHAVVRRILFNKIPHFDIGNRSNDDTKMIAASSAGYDLEVNIKKNPSRLTRIFDLFIL